MHALIGCWVGIIFFYYMALACGRYNARFDWLIVTELQGIILP